MIDSLPGFNPATSATDGLFSYQGGRLEEAKNRLSSALSSPSDLISDEARETPSKFSLILDEKQILEEYHNPKTPQQKKLREASDEFVSIMFNMLLKQMRKTVPKSGLMDGGQAEEIWRDFLDTEYSKAAVKQGDFPIAHRLYEQMSRSIR